MSTQLWITLFGIIGGFAVQGLIIYGGFKYFSGSTNARLDNLEKKMDKHNGLVEKVAVLEQKDVDKERRLASLERTKPAGS